MKAGRHKHKELVGTVIGDKMQKTVIVETRMHVAHPRYGKTYLRRTKFAAHDEKQVAKAGDVVRIRETRPLSKTKNWKLVEVIRAAKLRVEKVGKRSRKKKKVDEEEATPKLKEATP